MADRIGTSGLRSFLPDREFLTQQANVVRIMWFEAGSEGFHEHWEAQEWS
jgi:hypothetical protein